MQNNKNSKESDENYTPNTEKQPVINLVLKVFGGTIDLDPCSNSLDSPNVPAEIHYTKEINSLGLLWWGKVFLNPPYSNALPFMENLVYSYQTGATKEAIALLKVGTMNNKGTGKLIEDHASAVCFWNAKNRRIGFINPAGEQRKKANFDCVLVYFGANWQWFREVFSPWGHVMATNKTINQLLQP